MNRVDELRAARGGYSVAFMAFLKLVSEKARFLICFFEGKDIKYYGPRLTMLNPSLSWRPVQCGGRKAVLKVREIIMTSAAYEDSNVAFFVDRDYGLSPIPVEMTNVYETPCYSIENLYVSVEVFERVLESEFGLTRESDEGEWLSLCSTLFRYRLQEFLDGVACINAWVWAHRRNELFAQTERQLDADSYNLNQFFDISLEKVATMYTIFDLQASSACSYSPSEEELSDLQSLIPDASRRSLIRGKFLAYFFRVFMGRLVDDAVKDRPSYFPGRMKGCLRPSERNFLSELSQYAETPECLRKFIMRQK